MSLIASRHRGLSKSSPCVVVWDATYLQLSGL